MTIRRFSFLAAIPFGASAPKLVRGLQRSLTDRERRRYFEII